MLLPIVTGAETQILRTVCDPVEKFDKSLKKLVEDMKETMKKASGLGIAAPQVGVNARVFLVTLAYKSGDDLVLPMVNPEILYVSDETEVGEEGCLSLPKEFGNVDRAREVVVKFQDVKGGENTLKLTGLDARVVQHELDHLNGVLFIDKLTGAVVM